MTDPARYIHAPGDAERRVGELIGQLERRIDAIDDRTHGAETMPQIDPTEFGRLQAQVAALRSDLDRITADVGEIKRSLVAIGEQLSEARGGWRTLMLVGGAAASLGGVVAWLVSHVRVQS